MKTWRTIVFLVLLSLKLVSCQGNVEYVGSVATPYIPPTLEPQEKTCYGWRLHLLSATVTDIGGGWITLSGDLAWENVDVSTSTYSFTFSPHFDQNLKAWPQLVVTTNEGYTYPLVTYTDYWIGRVYVPPGYFYRMPRVDLYVKVSAATTGWKIDTPCGLIDFANPEVDLDITQWSNTLPLGTTLVVDGDVSLTVNSVTTCSWDEPDDPDASLCVMVDMKNLNLGYERQIPFRYTVIMSNGYIYDYDEGWYSPERGGPFGRLGPGQEITLSAGTVRPGDLLIIQLFSMEGTRTIGGETWTFLIQESEN